MKMLHFHSIQDHCSEIEGKGKERVNASRSQPRRGGIFQEKSWAESSDVEQSFQQEVSSERILRSFSVQEPDQ